MIVSAFPACGKTYLFRHQETLRFETHPGKFEKLSFLDSDSSKFDKTDNWEKKYVDHIEAWLGSVDFLFISQHDGVLAELNRRGMPFVVVMPNNMHWVDKEKRDLIKQQWFGRFLLRDNSHIKDLDKWMQVLKDNYDSWTSLESIEKKNPTDFFLLDDNQYLKDIIMLLYTKKEHDSKYMGKGENEQC